MKNYLLRIALVAIVGVAGLGIATADEWDKKTTITIDEAMQLPNVMLQPGTYVLKLHESASNRHVVQIFDKDEKHVVTTVIAIPNMRLQPTGKSVFAFWEVPAGKPKALRAWYYPGDTYGQEFAYPKEEAAQISAANNGATVPIDNTKPEELGASAAAAPSAEPSPAAPVATAEPTPASQPVTVAAAPQTPPAPVAVSEPTPASVAATATQAGPSAESLPKTASNLPLVGLLGLLSLAAAFGLNFLYHRS